MSAWIQDLTVAFRRLRQQPGFTMVAVLTLMLGLGANTAIFTLIHAAARRPLPVARPHELYRLGDSLNCCVNTGLQGSYSLFSTRAFEHLRASLPVFDELAAFPAATAGTAVRPPDGGPTIPIRASFVSANYFNMLGTSPAAGRLIAPDDDDRASPPVMVLTYRAWVDRFGGDPDLIGRQFLVGGVGVTLVGISERGFFGETRRANPVEAWFPLGHEPTLRGETAALEDRTDTDWLYAMGRITTEVDTEALGARATASFQSWLSTQTFLSESQRESLEAQHIVVTPAPGGVQSLGQRFGDSLTVLLAMSALVLLIAAANLANLLLARADRVQTAIRAALGASARRLMRQSLSEGLLLALIGCAGAIGVSMLATRAVVSLAFASSSDVPLDLMPSTPILLFSIALALVTGVAFAAAPALAASRIQPIDALRGAAREGSERAFVPRRSLVIVQVTLSVVLLAGAGLLSRNLSQLEGQPMGFESADRLVVNVDIPFARGGDIARLDPMYRTIRERLQQVPGIRRVSYSLYSPMSGGNWSSGMSIAGNDEELSGQTPSWNRIGPDYFETLGTRMLQGRGIRETDTPGSEHVAVINNAFAQRYFPDANPIGATLGVGDASHASDFRIVGVVEDVKYSGPASPVRPMVFFPVLQVATYEDPSNTMVHARSTLAESFALELVPGSAGLGLEPEIRRVLNDVDPDLTVTRVATLTSQVAGNFRISRLMATLAGAYGVLALALAALGLYGVTAYGVSRRTHEFGVRMALGAEARHIVVQVLRSAVLQSVTGLAIGVPLALLAGRALSSQLYEVTSSDPAVLGTSAAVLLVTAALAAVFPAWRASRVNPTRALRAQ